LAAAEARARQNTMTTDKDAVAELEKMKNTTGALKHKLGPQEFIGNNVAPLVNPLLERLDKYLGAESPIDRALRAVKEALP
jgi:hypothetical protein